MALDFLSTGPEYPRSDHEDINYSGKIAKIKSLRQALTINPFDPYRWVELALQYTILGITEKADRALRTAYGLAREDRYVLRSLTRFKLHTHSPDEALRALVKSERLTSDPWLLATYFATADLAKSKFRFFKEAVRLNASTNISNFNKAELSAQLASLELSAGNERRAKRLFRQSLIDPTENALAQAVWASRRANIAFDPAKLPPPRSFEADALKALFSGEWEVAFEQARKWQEDEPFTGKAALLASFLGSVAFDRFEQAESLAELGFQANPDNGLILSNVAFCQASLGKLEEAKATVTKVISLKATDAFTKVAILANQGLIAFREGLLEEGRDRYSEAINSAEREGHLGHALMAQIFLDMEEFRVASPLAGPLYEKVKQAVKNRRDPELILAFERLSSLAKNMDDRPHPAGHR